MRSAAGSTHPGNMREKHLQREELYSFRRVPRLGSRSSNLQIAVLRFVLWQPSLHSARTSHPSAIERAIQASRQLYERLVRRPLASRSASRPKTCLARARGRSSRVAWPRVQAPLGEASKTAHSIDSSPRGRQEAHRRATSSCHVRVMLVWHMYKHSQRARVPGTRRLSAGMPAGLTQEKLAAAPLSTCCMRQLILHQTAC